jgi:hypothetical protein
LAGHGPCLEFARNPVTQLGLGLRYLRCLLNHRRVSPHCRQRKAYALFDDPGHDFALIHYYITRQAQARQLAAAGFRLLDVIDGEGHDVAGDDDDSASPNLMYVAARA